jgi:cytochrome c-type biogenesis protein CcmH/NrfG
MARLCLGDAEGARRALRRAIELAPERPDLAAALTKLEATAN